MFGVTNATSMLYTELMLCSRSTTEGDVPAFTSKELVGNACVTVLFVLTFVLTKSAWDQIRKQYFSKITVVVIGAGPIGLSAMLIAAKTSKVARLILYEEKCRYDLINRPQQIALDARSVAFLRQKGVDFENIEGCWGNQCFFTRIGIFQEYLLSAIDQLEIHSVIKLNTKFTKDSISELEKIPGRVMVIACDGLNGQAARTLGLREEWTQQSCKYYGAVAGIERTDQRPVPSPEIRVHGLTFDLSAFYGKDFKVDEKCGFSLKIFGSDRQRYMSLAVPKCDSNLIKALKVALDHSIMRNIFKECFNTYKTDTESKITDLQALKKLKFSPRLFEIKLCWRRETVMYLEDEDIVVTCEGDAARTLNFHSGLDVNLSIRGLESLTSFIHSTATANNNMKSLIEAMTLRATHARKISEHFQRYGIAETMEL
ncbi:uncharacterized protein LOC106165791 [Lingula anatina]|uniref:Uncharacterized protein LOC106156401 n=1 Tax=Lingula anatina TaxID=7574 RepID=A0A1S3HLX9_LINAN|nr:uncharacterized protein LOC106156401 [Lingula anatina]XP_013387086.1 uncharacterized protein LOC106156401 [Lingula anatina]XP_013387088.1 uncharacterized protein LOC106156401 [Lingula anatina]XP_013387089.1 uncharacterized protein LOC106156401 [Lingula anatina]XP_013387090.1 uncharacterized protein LOC106156401 [Lingula anatina]XP_013387091.1 uncharacterized protein LOC106156401 [Lingula anatina]XP_013387092.1 uncharacterized protein LOC106156401 [Lingula anatina]XP_013387093.1 uncharacte|eukprot:XP_013387085.1 uncharacterized protein LOC106156401 [Lingula anatina]